jgi:hypothetical protein
MLDDAWKPQGFSFRLCLDSGVVHLLGFHWQKPFHLQKERVQTPERRSLYEILGKGRNQSPTFNTFRNLAEARSNRPTRWQRRRRRRRKKTDATIYVHRKQKWNFWEGKKKHKHGWSCHESTDCSHGTRFDAVCEDQELQPCRGAHELFLAAP